MDDLFLLVLVPLTRLHPSSCCLSSDPLQRGDALLFDLRVLFLMRQSHCATQIAEISRSGVSLFTQQLYLAKQSLLTEDTNMWLTFFKSCALCTRTFASVPVLLAELFDAVYHLDDCAFVDALFPRLDLSLHERTTFWRVFAQFFAH